MDLVPEKMYSCRNQRSNPCVSNPERSSCLNPYYWSWKHPLKSVVCVQMFKLISVPYVYACCTLSHAVCCVDILWGMTMRCRDVMSMGHHILQRGHLGIIVLSCSIPVTPVGIMLMMFMMMFNEYLKKGRSHLSSELKRSASHVIIMIDHVWNSG